MKKTSRGGPVSGPAATDPTALDAQAPGHARDDADDQMPVDGIADDENDGLAPGVWDLWLRPAGDHGPAVRLARLLDDVADKNPVFTFPRARVRTPHGPVEAGPYYTRDNDLSLAVVALDA